MCNRYVFMCKSYIFVYFMCFKFCNYHYVKLGVKAEFTKLTLRVVFGK